MNVSSIVTQEHHQDPCYYLPLSNYKVKVCINKVALVTWMKLVSDRFDAGCKSVDLHACIFSLFLLHCPQSASEEAFFEAINLEII